MQDLDQAIQVSGGVGALAAAIGVPNANAISMWRARGRVPRAWEIVISQYLKQKTPPTQSSKGNFATESVAA